MNDRAGKIPGRTLRKGTAVRRTATMTGWRALLVACLLATPIARAAGAEPIVIGQSLHMNEFSYTGRRIMAGAEVYIRHTNDSGGINGRPIKLVTLDDGGDPRRHAANLRSLVTEHHAVALLNCVGDRACRAAAAVAAEYRVPLVGPMSGARALRTPRQRYVYPVRAGYDREAEALARQLRSVGMGSLAVLTDAANDAESVADLVAAAANEKIRVARIRLAAPTTQAIDTTLKALAQGNHDVVLLDFDPATVDTLAQHSREIRYEWPGMLVSLTSGSPSVMARIFRDRVIGFTSIVPNPEASPKSLALDFMKQVDRAGMPAAVAFEGLESYLNTRVCVEALRRAGTRPEPERIAAALETLQFDAGDFPVDFGRNRTSGSDWVEIGLRTRDGKFVR